MGVLKRFWDVVCTLMVWAYFTVGYLVFFSPIHLFLFLFSPARERAFQRTNSCFYRGFLRVLKGLSRDLEISVEDGVRAIRGAVIISNHISYLDPILLISIYPVHKTVVKGLFFRVPIFGWVLRYSGYLPSSGREGISSVWMEQMEKMGDHLSSGGNLFIFPEGTRSRSGRVGRFQEGAFRIARRHHVPIKVLRIEGTDAVFPPEKFLFNIRPPHVISVRLLGEVAPEIWHEGTPVSEVADRVRAMYGRDDS
ncbi:MAG: lysophospholipid acyltransferase family protein [Thermodesulfobacteriota bacterium]